MQFAVRKKLSPDRARGGDAASPTGMRFASLQSLVGNSGVQQLVDDFSASVEGDTEAVTTSTFDAWPPSASALPNARPDSAGAALAFLTQSDSATAANLAAWPAFRGLASPAAITSGLAVSTATDSTSSSADATLASDAGSAAASGGTPTGDADSARDVFGRERSREESNKLQELEQLDALASSSTLSDEAQSRRERLRNELGRRDEERRASNASIKEASLMDVNREGDELIVRLGSQIIGRIRIEAGTSFFFAQVYRAETSSYVARLMINGNYQVEPTAGARDTLADHHVDFDIVRTSESLQEIQVHLGRPVAPKAPAARPATTAASKVPAAHAASPTAARPAAAIAPVGQGTRVEATPARTQTTQGVLALRESLARGEGDVESLATGLSPAELGALNFDERVRLLEQIAGNWFVGDEKERTMNDLIDTTPEADAARLIARLRAQRSALLKKLESVIDGEEYVKFHEALRRLHLRSLTPDRAFEDAEAARKQPLVWADPDLLGFMRGGSVAYRVSSNDDGTLHVRRWVSSPLGDMELAPFELDPFQMVAVYFKYGEELLGGAKGSMVYMPAENLRLLENKQFRREVDLAFNVGMIFGGGAGIARATSRLALALATAEVALGATNIVMADYKSDLEKTPEGTALVRTWEVVNLLFSAYSFGRTVWSASRALRQLRDAFKAWKAVKGGVDPAIAARVEREMAELLTQVDEVDAALNEEPAANAAQDTTEAGKLAADIRDTPVPSAGSKQASTLFDVVVNEKPVMEGPSVLPELPVEFPSPSSSKFEFPVSHPEDFIMEPDTNMMLQRQLSLFDIRPAMRGAGKTGRAANARWNKLMAYLYKFVPEAGKTYEMNGVFYTFDEEKRLVRVVSDKNMRGLRWDYVNKKYPGKIKGFDYGHVGGVDAFGTNDILLQTFGGFAQEATFNRTGAWAQAEGALSMAVHELQTASKPFHKVAEVRNFIKGVPTEWRIYVESEGKIVYDSGWLQAPKPAM